MLIYAYENHMGGIYFSQFEVDIDDLYCGQCGDYDWLIGKACNAKDMIPELYDVCCKLFAGDFKTVMKELECGAN